MSDWSLGLSVSTGRDLLTGVSYCCHPGTHRGCPTREQIATCHKDTNKCEMASVMTAGQEEKDGLLAHMIQDIEEWAGAHTGSLERGTSFPTARASRGPWCPARCLLGSHNSTSVDMV